MSDNTGYNMPTYYDYINANVSIISPSTVHVHNTGLSRFFRRYLLQKAMSVFKWELPKYWDRDYFLYTLYCSGYISVINTDKYGAIPQMCGLQGYDIFYRPANVIITNALLKGMLSLKIDIQCVLLKLQPDYGGIMDIVDFYADMLALGWKTGGVNLTNSQLSYIFTTDNKAGAESLKKLYDKVASGEPAVVQDKALKNKDGSNAWEPFQQNVGQNYILGDILSDMKKIENMFNTAIGIPNANTDKKERLLTNEVDANNTETSTLCELWLEQLQKGCNKANEMFGINMSVDWRVKPQTTDNKSKKESEEENAS